MVRSHLSPTPLRNRAARAALLAWPNAVGVLDMTGSTGSRAGYCVLSSATGHRICGNDQSVGK